MNSARNRGIAHPAAWKGGELAGKDDIAFDLGRRHLDAIGDAVAAVREIEAEAIGKADFALPAIADELAVLADEIDRGRGIVLLRGLPVGDYAPAEVEKLYWGIGSHFGTAVSQSVMGDRLGHVVDVTDTDPDARAYRARQELALHTDLSDIVSFLALERAKRGGLSRFASALAVHDEMLSRRPELLDVLYRGFFWHRLGEQGPDEAPITPYRVPVFCCLEGQVSCRYVRNYIREAAYDMGGLSEREEAALDYFDALAARPDMRIEFMLEPGEAVVMNNFTVLHARTAFENHDDPARKRHLLRLWLAARAPRPVAPEMEVYATGPGGGVPPQEGRAPTFRRRASVA